MQQKMATTEMNANLVLKANVADVTRTMAEMQMNLASK
jgi:hypothetical protein